jgi:hypothetical protein
VWTRLRTSFQPSTGILAALVVAFIVVRAIAIHGGTVEADSDAPTYAYDGTPDQKHGPLISFIGNAPRAWTVPVFYYWFPTDEARAVGQSVFGLLAWIALAVALWFCCQRLPARIVAAASVLALASLPQLTDWDFSILSESLSISFGALTLALLLHWLRTRADWALIALTVVAVLWTFTRSEMGFMVVFVVAAIALRWLREPGRPRRYLVSAAVLVVGLVWGALIIGPGNRSFAVFSENHLTYNEENFTYRLEHQILINPAIDDVYRNQLGMPGCPAIDAFIQSTQWDSVKFQTAYLSCPALRAWSDGPGSSSGYRFALVAPGLFLADTWHNLAESLDSTGPHGAPLYGDGSAPSVLPVPVERFAFPDRPVLLRWLIIDFAVLIVAVAASLAWRRRTLLVVTALVMVAVCLASVGLGVMNSAGIYGRFGVQEAFGIRIALIMLLVAVIDTVSERIAERHREPPQVSAPAAESVPEPTSVG